jgi:hypothetical protein
MDFSWTSEQDAYKRAVVDFARANLNDEVIERDRRGELSLDNWRKCAEFGILGLPVSPDYGGAGEDILTTMLVMEGLGYGCTDLGLLFAINAQMWSVQHPIETFGTQEQKERYLPGLCRGEVIGAHGMTEPDAGSDTASLRARAKKVDGGYVLSGVKTFSTNAPICHMAVIFATLDPERGRSGISAFLVDREAQGFSVSNDISKMGLRTSPMSEIVLRDCFVPDSARLGPEGAGLTVFNSSMEWERSCILAGNVGAMERQLEGCIRYARERRQFGQPIGRFQSVSNRIADMKMRLETSRLLLYKVAWMKAKGQTAVLEAALAKLYLSECFVQSSLDAIRIHGGYGYTTEFQVERDLRDSIGGTLYSGTSDIQRVIVSRLLGL